MAGRVQPSLWTAPDGSYVLCLGADRLDEIVDAWPGYRVGVNGLYPTTFAGGETLQITADGGSTQTVTFASTDQTTEQVVAAINTQTTGVTATVVEGETKITSDTIGFRSSVGVIGGTGMATLGFSSATDYGYGGLQGGDYVGWSQASVNFTTLTLLTFGMKFVQPTNTGITFRLVVLVGGAEVYEVTPDQGQTIEAETRTVNVAAITGSQTLEFRLEALAA
jgi:hypothetical protein